MTEPQWLIEKRKEAENLLDALPDEKVRYVVAPAAKPKDGGRHAANSYAAAVVQQDSETTIHIPESFARKGVIIKEIKEALQDERLAKYFAQPQSRQAAANMAFFDSGALILVPDNTRLEEPLYHIVSSEGSVVSRNIIIAGRNSRVKIIQNIIGSGNYSDATAVDAMEDSSVELVCIQNLGKGAAYIKRKAICAARSFLDVRTAFFGSESTYARSEIDLAGEGSEASTLDIYFGTGAQRFDSLSLMNHKARNTKSRSDVRGALRDGAKLAPHGNVKIDKEARASDAFLTEHILLLDSGAEADPVPALEIATNDVKAGHAASVSHVDEEQVFYLQARGLDESEARKMIVMGFLEPALKMAETLRAHVLSNLEEKWGKH